MLLKVFILFIPKYIYSKIEALCLKCYLPFWCVSNWAFLFPPGATLPPSLSARKDTNKSDSWAERKLLTNYPGTILASGILIVEGKLRNLRKKWENSGKTEKVQKNWESGGKPEKLRKHIQKVDKNWEWSEKLRKLRILRKNLEIWGKTEKVEKSWESWGKTEIIEENWKSCGKTEKVEEKLRKLRKRLPTTSLKQRSVRWDSQLGQQPSVTRSAT